MTWFIELQNEFNESRLFKISTIYILNWIDNLTSWHSLCFLLYSLSYSLLHFLSYFSSYFHHISHYIFYHISHQSLYQIFYEIDCKIDCKKKIWKKEKKYTIFSNKNWVQATQLDLKLSLSWRKSIQSQLELKIELSWFLSTQLNSNLMTNLVYIELNSQSLMMITQIIA